MAEQEHRSVTLFREYLRIPSVHPEPDYGKIREGGSRSTPTLPASIVKFLKKYADENKFIDKFEVIETAPGKPLVVLTVLGQNPSLPSILLNSHTDVVPVFPECWTYDPFSAHKDEDGNIYARGSQDMKCVGIQHLEAMRELAAKGIKLSRTVHLSFVPDEEIGGKLGVKIWVASDHFKSLNIGFALDEGLATVGEEVVIFFSERLVRWIDFRAEGHPGHGSRFLPDTAGYKIHKIMGKILEFRDQQEALLKEKTSLGDVSTINITSLRGGVQPNVVPSELFVGIDLRVTPDENEKMDSLLEEWCKECDVSLVYRNRQEEHGVTATDPKDKWWRAFSGALDDCHVKYKAEVAPGGTDMRYLRHVGVPALGFSPMNNTPVLLHDHNEFLNEKVFLDGIPIFMKIIQAVANLVDE